MVPSFSRNRCLASALLFLWVGAAGCTSASLPDAVTPDAEPDAPAGEPEDGGTSDSESALDAGPREASGDVTSRDAGPDATAEDATSEANLPDSAVDATTGDDGEAASPDAAGEAAADVTLPDGAPADASTTDGDATSNDGSGGNVDAGSPVDSGPDAPLSDGATAVAVCDWASSDPAGFVYPMNLAVDPQGNIYLVTSNAPFKPATYQFYKFDSNCNLLWSTKISTGASSFTLSPFSFSLQGEWATSAYVNSTLFGTFEWGNTPLPLDRLSIATIDTNGTGAYVAIDEPEDRKSVV